jgi:hypothetical protein
MKATRLSRRGWLLLGAAFAPAARAIDFGIGTKGSGERVQRELDVGEFDRIEIAGSLAIELQ